MRRLGLADFGDIQETSPRRPLIFATPGGLKNWLREQNPGPATAWGSHYATYTNQWLQANVPDYTEWQERCKRLFPDGIVRAGYLPGEVLVDGKSAHRIYLPREYNDERIRKFVDKEFEMGSSLPPGSSGDARAEYLRHFTHMYVTSIFIGTDGKPRPDVATWIWYPDPASDDVVEARIEDVDFPGSDGSEIGEVTYPDAD